MHDKTTTVLIEWLHIEDTGMIYASDEGEQSDNLEINEGSVDNAQLLQEALPLLQRLHAIGAKISDFSIMDAARELHMCT